MGFLLPCRCNRERGVRGATDGNKYRDATAPAAEAIPAHSAPRPVLRYRHAATSYPAAVAASRMAVMTTCGRSEVPPFTGTNLPLGDSIAARACTSCHIAS